MTRARTQGFWNQRQPRAISEAVAVIATPSKPATKATRAPTVRTRRSTSSGGTSGDDFLEEVPTNVVTEE